MGSIQPHPKRIVVIGSPPASTLSTIRDCLEAIGVSSHYEVTESIESSVAPVEIALVFSQSDAQSQKIHSILAQARSVLLNLEEVSAVDLAMDYKDKLRWFSTREPRRILGPLVDIFEGTYFDLVERMILDSRDLCFLAFPFSPASHHDIHPFIASVAIACQLGLSDNRIRGWLARQPEANATEYNYDSKYLNSAIYSQNRRLI